MANADDFRRLALGFKGTVAEPHMDRTAFRVVRTYATLAPDELTANIKLMPDEQHFKCMRAPEIFSPVAGGWGKQGWTSVQLDQASEDELIDALKIAWLRGRLKKLPKTPLEPPKMSRERF